jgi:hypothetical protein
MGKMGTHPIFRLLAFVLTYDGGIHVLSRADPINKKPHANFEMGFCFTSASFSHPLLHKTKQRA